MLLLTNILRDIDFVCSTENFPKNPSFFRVLLKIEWTV